GRALEDGRPYDPGGRLLGRRGGDARRDDRAGQAERVQGERPEEQHQKQCSRRRWLVGDDVDPGPYQPDERQLQGYLSALSVFVNLAGWERRRATIGQARPVVKLTHGAASGRTGRPGCPLTATPQVLA